ncbi:transposase [Streptomyces rhizosphaerihabitans]|nr:transposase [Streptomyces rhizosphaerihabitans]
MASRETRPGSVEARAATFGRPAQVRRILLAEGVRWRRTRSWTRSRTPTSREKDQDHRALHLPARRRDGRLRRRARTGDPPHVPASAGQGIDAGKKIAGRKRHLGVDTLGLLLAVRVTAANVSDNVGGIHLLSWISTSNQQVRKAWTDTGYRTKAIDHGARLGIDVEAVRRDPAVKGFKVIPRRWVVERTFGWLRQSRTALAPPELVVSRSGHPHRDTA